MSCRSLSSAPTPHRTPALRIAVLFLATLAVTGCSQNRDESTRKGSSCPFARLFGSRENRVRLEHVALNVEDPEAVARWYCDNLRMKVRRKGPPPVNMHFISDARGNMMLELYRNPEATVPDYRSTDPLSLHIAFMVDDVEGVRKALLAAGATLVEDVKVTEAGDQLAMLRDPWGIPIQFLKRAKPMLRHR
ncbi:MAG: VOC family protein [Phycisphaerales bacterium]|nr:MAG: VOC family protein [Phycisphaerales bacterium]